MSVKLEKQKVELQKKINGLQNTINQLQKESKELLQKSQASKGATRDMYKQKCMMILKKKKQYQNQLNGYFNQLGTIDQLTLQTQSMKNHKQMMEAMKDAVTEQKKQMQKVDIDHMMDIQDDMMDMKFEQQYMNEMMNRNYDVDVDEDQLDDELMEFEREIAKEKKGTNTNKNNQNKNVEYGELPDYGNNVHGFMK